MIEPIIKYPFDDTGTAQSNRVLDESRQIIAGGTRTIIPKGGPFFSNNVSIRVPGHHSPLVENVDYEIRYLHTEATSVTGEGIYIAIHFIDENFSGDVLLTYSVVGGSFNIFNSQVSDIINQIIGAYDEVDYSNITGLPAAFPPMRHLHYAQDLVNFHELVAALNGRSEAMDRVLFYDTTPLERMIEQSVSRVGHVQYNPVEGTKLVESHTGFLTCVMNGTRERDSKIWVTIDVINGKKAGQLTLMVEEFQNRVDNHQITNDPNLDIQINEVFLDQERRICITLGEDSVVWENAVVTISKVQWTKVDAIYQKIPMLWSLLDPVELKHRRPTHAEYIYVPANDLSARCWGYSTGHVAVDPSLGDHIVTRVSPVATGSVNKLMFEGEVIDQWVGWTKDDGTAMMSIRIRHTPDDYRGDYENLGLEWVLRINTPAGYSISNPAMVLEDGSLLWDFEATDVGIHYYAEVGQALVQRLDLARISNADLSKIVDGDELEPYLKQLEPNWDTHYDTMVGTRSGSVFDTDVETMHYTSLEASVISSGLTTHNTQHITSQFTLYNPNTPIFTAVEVVRDTLTSRATEVDTIATVTTETNWTEDVLTQTQRQTTEIVLSNRDTLALTEKDTGFYYIIDTDVNTSLYTDWQVMTSRDTLASRVTSFNTTVATITSVETAVTSSRMTGPSGNGSGPGWLTDVVIGVRDTSWFTDTTRVTSVETAILRETSFDTSYERLTDKVVTRGTERETTFSTDVETLRNTVVENDVTKFTTVDTVRQSALSQDTTFDTTVQTTVNTDVTTQTTYDSLRETMLVNTLDVERQTTYDTMVDVMTDTVVSIVTHPSEIGTTILVPTTIRTSVSTTVLTTGFSGTDFYTDRIDVIEVDTHAERITVIETDILETHFTSVVGRQSARETTALTTVQTYIPAATSLETTWQVNKDTLRVTDQHFRDTHTSYNTTIHTTEEIINTTVREGNRVTSVNFYTTDDTDPSKVILTSIQRETEYTEEILNTSVVNTSINTDIEEDRLTKITSVLDTDRRWTTTDTVRETGDGEITDTYRLTSHETGWNGRPEDLSSRATTYNTAVFTDVDTSVTHGTAVARYTDAVVHSSEMVDTFLTGVIPADANARVKNTTVSTMANVDVDTHTYIDTIVDTTHDTTRSTYTQFGTEYDDGEGHVIQALTDRLTDTAVTEHVFTAENTRVDFVNQTLMARDTLKETFQDATVFTNMTWSVENNTNIATSILTAIHEEAVADTTISSVEQRETVRITEVRDNIDIGERETSYDTLVLTAKQTTMAAHTDVTLQTVVISAIHTGETVQVMRAAGQGTEYNTTVNYETIVETTVNTTVADVRLVPDAKSTWRDTNTTYLTAVEVDGVETTRNTDHITETTWDQPQTLANTYMVNTTYDTTIVTQTSRERLTTSGTAEASAAWTEWVELETSVRDTTVRTLTDVTLDVLAGNDTQRLTHRLTVDDIEDGNGPGEVPDTTPETSVVPDTDLGIPDGTVSTGIYRFGEWVVTTSAGDVTQRGLLPEYMTGDSLPITDAPGINPTTGPNLSITAFDSTTVDVNVLGLVFATDPSENFDYVEATVSTDKYVNKGNLQVTLDDNSNHRFILPFYAEDLVNQVTTYRLYLTADQVLAVNPRLIELVTLGESGELSTIKFDFYDSEDTLATGLNAVMEIGQSLVTSDEYYGFFDQESTDSDWVNIVTPSTLRPATLNLSEGSDVMEIVKCYVTDRDDEPEIRINVTSTGTGVIGSKMVLTYELGEVEAPYSSDTNGSWFTAYQPYADVKQLRDWLLVKAQSGEPQSVNIRWVEPDASIESTLTVGDGLSVTDDIGLGYLTGNDWSTTNPGTLNPTAFQYQGATATIDELYIEEDKVDGQMTLSVFVDSTTISGGVVWIGTDGEVVNARYVSSSGTVHKFETSSTAHAAVSQVQALWEAANTSSSSVDLEINYIA